jgi:excisionase family DNA binding protein
MNHLLTTAEAAKILGVSERRVRQFCIAGRLGLKVGGRYTIDSEELQKFMEKPRPPGRPPRTPPTD